MQTRDEVFISGYAFIKKTFPKQNAKLFVWQRLKEKLLPVAKSCPRSLARVIHFLFCKNAFQNTDFSRLK